MKSINASRKSIEKVVYNNLKDNREIQKPKYILEQLVRTADIEKILSEVIVQIIVINYSQ